MTNTLTDLPQDLAQAHAMILAERAARVDDQALVVYLKLEIEKLKRELYGTRSERKARLLDQLEMQLEDAYASGEGRLVRMI